MPTDAMHTDPTPEEIQPLVKRLLHDMRNHLNGIGMETVFLSDSLTDPEALGAVAQIEKDAGKIEHALRTFGIRLATPQREIVSASDTFRMWQSACRKLKLAGDDAWRCDIGSELIDVDMRMIADALCELLPASAGQTFEATVSTRENGVEFQVRESSASDISEPSLPGFERVIAANGGTFTSDADEATGARTSKCWFPVAKQ